MAPEIQIPPFPDQRSATGTKGVIGLTSDVAWPSAGPATRLGLVLWAYGEGWEREAPSAPATKVRKKK